MSEKTVLMKYTDVEAMVKHYLADAQDSPVDPKDLGTCVRVVPHEGQVSIVFASPEKKPDKEGAS